LGLGLVACGPAQDPNEEAATLTAIPDAISDSGSDEPETEVEEPAEEAPEEEPAEVVESDTGSTEDSGEPFDVFAGADESDFETTDSGLQYVVMIEGDGDTPEVGQVVSVHYTGWLEDGTEFDSSRERGVPISFALGQGMVIPGWDEGIALLPAGSQARFIIPSDLAYGDAGRPGIPGGATLVFDVELVEVSPGAPESPTVVDEADYTETETGLLYYDMEEGSGADIEEGQQVLLHYTGWLEDGMMFDSSLNRGQPIPVVVGAGQVFPGWEEGLLSMKVGGKRQLVIPPELAFGEEGAGGGIIPPNAVIILELELLEAQ